MRRRLPLTTLLVASLSGAAHGAAIFLNILPPGADGLIPASTVTPGVHAVDQLAMYRDLILAAPGLGDAATVDLRGQTVLPAALPLAAGDRRLRDAVRLLRDWMRAGAHRRDRDGDGRYDDAAAVALM